MALDNHINLADTRDYINLNFTILNFQVHLINEVFSVEIVHMECFLNWIILIMCLSSLSLFMDGAFYSKWQSLQLLKVLVEDISKQNIIATCFHSIITPFLSQTFLILAPVLFFLLSLVIIGGKKIHFAILEWEKIEND